MGNKEKKKKNFMEIEWGGLGKKIGPESPKLKGPKMEKSPEMFKS